MIMLRKGTGAGDGRAAKPCPGRACCGAQGRSGDLQLEARAMLRDLARHGVGFCWGWRERAR